MPFAVVQATFWDHGGSAFTPVPQPTWEAIAGELTRKRSASLAGSVGTAFGTMTLQRHAAGWLVVARPTDGAKALWLTDPARAKAPAALGCCGSAKLPGVYIIADAPATAAARHFYDTGACSPDLTWSETPPG